METRKGMSAATAFFLGMWITGSVAIAGGTVFLLCVLNVVDGKIGDIVHLGRDAIGNASNVVKALQPLLGDVFNDQRNLGYAKQIEVKIHSPSTSRNCGRPSLTISNTGTEVISRLTVRVTAIDDSGSTRYEWTEMAATPIAINNQFRGPILPGDGIRRLVFSEGPCVRGEELASLSLKAEIAEIFVWSGSASTASGNSTRMD
jgi:hypothetical protein